MSVTRDSAAGSLTCVSGCLSGEEVTCLGSGSLMSPENVFDNVNTVDIGQSTNYGKCNRPFDYKF